MTLQCTSHTSLPRSTFSPGNFEIGNFSKKGKTSCWGLFLPDLFTGPKYSRSICIRYHQLEHFVALGDQCLESADQQGPPDRGKDRALLEMIEFILINCNCETVSLCHCVTLSLALKIWAGFSPQYTTIQLCFVHQDSLSLYLYLNRNLIDNVASLKISIILHRAHQANGLVKGPLARTSDPAGFGGYFYSLAAPSQY